MNPQRLIDALIEQRNDLANKNALLMAENAELKEQVAQPGEPPPPPEE